MTDLLKNKISETACNVEVFLKEYYSKTNANSLGYERIVDSQLYSLLAGGKRIRAFLVSAFTELYSDNSQNINTKKNAVALASAIEMIHTFSLIHDDLPCMDNDVLRRGKNTCHVEFDEATALLAGDALSIGAFEVIADSELSPVQIKRAIKALSSCSGWNGMIAGQILDMKGENTRLSYEELCVLHSLKTGKLIECACVLGCIAADVPENDRRYIDAISYAQKIGVAFQITDDILDRTSTAKELGKTVGKDENSHKTTYLSFKSLDDAAKDAGKLTNEAVEIISKYENSSVLVELANYLAERKN